jgi:hypothetical protein
LPQQSLVYGRSVSKHSKLSNPHLDTRDSAVELEITPDVANVLGHYVYIYVDPRNEEVFYVGKGVGARATAHLDAKKESRKTRRIRDIRDAGNEPRIEIVAHKLRDEVEAFRIEAALIEVLGTTNLTNQVHGWGSNESRRKPLADFIMEGAARPVDVCDPCLLIRINKLFRYGSSAKDLYESTRGTWVIGKRRESAQYAMAVFAGVVREVYEITSWHPGGSTPYESRDTAALARHEGRWEFIGQVAASSVREKYVGGSVQHYFVRGQQSPVVGVGLTLRQANAKQ